MKIIYIAYFLIPWLLVYLFTYFYGRNTKRWVWKEYYAVAAGPVAGVIVLSFFMGAKVLLYFVLCAAVGFSGELLLGLFCKRVLNKRLWYYTKKPLLGGHTSLLNLPLWAGGGMLFFLLAKLFIEY